jgi:hypothetical protein
MDLKRAISRVETIAHRPSWQHTEQSAALKVVIEAAKKQLPPEPKDHLHLYKYHGEWRINDVTGGSLQTKKFWEDNAVPYHPHAIVKVPV